ncbi:MAG: RNA polymerase sigma factor [Chloroflexota bacterium]
MRYFESLYEKHAADVYRFAFWLAGNAPEADDITSETFMRAWTDKENIRVETVKAYLFTIARNIYLKQQRVAKRTTRLSIKTESQRLSPETAVQLQSELEAAQQAMQTLPEADRAALLLRVYHELPYAEIARMLNISLSAAKVKVHRARLKLAALREES